jgi:hypothetical protein
VSPAPIFCTHICGLSSDLSSLIGLIVAHLLAPVARFRSIVAVPGIALLRFRVRCGEEDWIQVNEEVS